MQQYPSLRCQVTDEEKMRPGHWPRLVFGFKVTVRVSALHFLQCYSTNGWGQERHPFHKNSLPFTAGGCLPEQAEKDNQGVTQAHLKIAR